MCPLNSVQQAQSDDEIKMVQSDAAAMVMAPESISSHCLQLCPDTVLSSHSCVMERNACHTFGGIAVA